MSTHRKTSRINRLISQINTNMKLLREQYENKEALYRIQYYSNPEDTDPYRYALEVKTQRLSETVRKLRS